MMNFILSPRWRAQPPHHEPQQQDAHAVDRQHGGDHRVVEHRRVLLPRIKAPIAPRVLPNAQRNNGRTYGAVR